MQKIWEWLCRITYNYGKYGAMQPSYHGSYEAPVPEALKFNSRLEKKS